MTIRLPEDQYVNAGEVKTRFWRLGECGPHIILLHGLGASAEIWLHNVEVLAKNHRIFIPDLAGFGRSERPSSSFTPLDYVSFLDDFMDALHIERASLVGQSLGGAIALKYALGFPHKVDKLVLADCGGFGQEVIWTLKLMSLPWIGEIVSCPSRAGVTLFFRLAVRNRAVITKEFIDLYYHLFTQPGFQAFLLKIVRKLVDFRGAKHAVLAPVMENLQRLKQPTLIIWGENDRVFPLKHASFGKERIPNAQLYIMKQCGHIPNLERPEEFNSVVLEFLDG